MQLSSQTQFIIIRIIIWYTIKNTRFRPVKFVIIMYKKKFIEFWKAFLPLYLGTDNVISFNTNTWFKKNAIIPTASTANLLSYAVFPWQIFFSQTVIVQSVIEWIYIYYILCTNVRYRRYKYMRRKGKWVRNGVLHIMHDN